MRRAEPQGEEPPLGNPGDPGDPAALLDRWTAHQADRGDRPDRRDQADQVEPAAPRHAAAPPASAGGQARMTDAVAVGREVLDALAPDVPEEPERTAEPGTQPAPAVAAPGPEVGPTLNVDFAPRMFARRVVGLLLLLALVATLGAAWLAYDDPRPLTLGGAGVLLVLTLALYAVRAGSAPTYLAIRSGQLEVRRGKTLEKFDLTSRYTRIEVVGRPGRPGWKVLLGRFGREPLVLTAALVDPHELTEQLARYRPEA